MRCALLRLTGAKRIIEIAATHGHSGALAPGPNAVPSPSAAPADPSAAPYNLEASLLCSFIHIELLPVGRERAFACVDLSETRVLHRTDVRAESACTRVQLNTLRLRDRDQLLEAYRRIVLCSDEDADDVVVDLSTFPIDEGEADAGGDPEPFEPTPGRRRMHTACFVEVNGMHVVMLTRFTSSISHFVGEVARSIAGDDPDPGPGGDADAEPVEAEPAAVPDVRSTVAVVASLSRCSLTLPRTSDAYEHFVFRVESARAWSLEDGAQPPGMASLVMKGGALPLVRNAMQSDPAFNVFDHDRGDARAKRRACLAALRSCRRHLSGSAVLVAMGGLSSEYVVLTAAGRRLSGREWIPATDMNLTVDNRYRGEPRAMVTLTVELLRLVFAEDEYNLLMGIIFEHFEELSPYGVDPPADLRPGDPQKPGAPAMHLHGVDDLRKHAVAWQFNLLADRLEGYNR